MVESPGTAGYRARRTRTCAAITGRFVSVTRPADYEDCVAAPSPTRGRAELATSHDWAILKEMEAEGAWPDSVRLVADSMAGDGLIDGMIPVEDSSLIGCTGR